MFCETSNALRPWATAAAGARRGHRLGRQIPTTSASPATACRCTAVAFARHVKKDLPLDLTASGEVGGAFTVRKSAGASAIWGAADAHRSRFAIRMFCSRPLQVAEVEFSRAQRSSRRRKRAAALTPAAATASPGFQFAISRFRSARRGIRPPPPRPLRRRALPRQRRRTPPRLPRLAEHSQSSGRGHPRRWGSLARRKST